ncbi:MAG: metallophosphoesterase family protein [Bacteroidales bacterium]
MTDKQGAAKSLRIAAVGDMHCTRTSQGAFQNLFAAIATSAEILLLCGDLTAYGLPEEAAVLARELTAAAKMPTIAVLGNHEYESGKEGEVRQILMDAGVRVLDGEACEILGVGFAGVKGFGGGFDRRALEPWGEHTMKRFVHESVEEALKLGSALARLRTAHRIAVLHYAPIRATVVGEPLEIFPFLGSSRLEEPLNRYNLSAVFHGHAHNGQPEGRTTAAVPVYNVAMSLLERHFPNRPPFRVLELPVAPRAVQQPAPAEGQRTRESMVTHEG